tara:strand:- start:2239 stop:2577 length:339 start_codon:yes stop_codon:yes gene_type:complete
MGIRYDSRQTRTAKLEKLRMFLEKRNRNSISHYTTAEFRYPEELDIANFSFVSHIWSSGDRYYKLAHKYYGDAELWWVIALYNNKPTEHHVKLGDVVFVPLPIEDVIDSFRV